MWLVDYESYIESKFAFECYGSFLVAWVVCVVYVFLQDWESE